MTKLVALLRGINVGGHTIWMNIPSFDLKCDDRCSRVRLVQPDPINLAHVLRGGLYIELTLNDETCLQTSPAN